MKEGHPKKLVMFSVWGLPRFAAYSFILALVYALGFITSFTGKSKSPENTTQVPPQFLESDLVRFRTKCSDPVPSTLVRQTILDKVYNGSSPYHGFPPSHTLGLLKPKRIKGWGSYGAVFENLVRRVKPRIIIEVGTFLGASAIHMADLSCDLGLKTQVICIDDFRGWPGFRERFKDISMVNGDVMLLHQFMQNVVYLNLTEQILPLPFSTSSALVKLCEWGVMGDLIEVDAGHDFHSAWSDINMAYALLRPGGVIFGHDYFTSADDRGVRRAVDLFARRKGLFVGTDGQHWVIG
ncbi:hypothetical protein AMTRI_Chr09g39060 [Amborella trichopoda]|uniref:S-adenosyl-L-methionine-dependent methyltransferase n=1 Tax=Amborella trichopoda TaxID=13333 RepID=W1NQI2_AMBTC|nr:uncharacterized protein LOC18425705 [Amborella trichopoda]ERM97698.1 hypothetical protein AMTR_s00121p00019080 [Amborella trichopoda]|eukprot:XP_006830282.1 uncharacterized protein LOC18425705 [Amborella trichopoda]